MIYALRHRTTYAYGNTVSFARCVLRLTPNSSPGQTVLKTQLKVTPNPTLRDERLGPFGEVMVTVLIDKRHETLVIEANSRIDVHAPPLPDAAASLPWEQVRAATFAASGSRMRPGDSSMPSSCRVGRTARCSFSASTWKASERVL